MDDAHALVVEGLTKTFREETAVDHVSFRVARGRFFGCALIHNPRLLFLDEPLNGIDPVSGRWVMVPVASGLALTLALVVASGQLVGVALHALSRHRHLHDRALFVGVTARSRVLLKGPMGALLEKDLRMVWRDPRQKAIVLTGLVAPLVLLVLVWQGSSGHVRPGVLLGLASFAGLSTLGSNAFALERRGLALLLGFPLERFLVLVGKNASALLTRREPDLLARVLGEE